MVGSMITNNSRKVHFAHNYVMSSAVVTKGIFLALNC